MTFRNHPATEYLSSLLGESNKYLNNNFDFAEPRKFYSKELFLGAGGCGKTHRNLNDKGLINPVFIAHSWKLANKEKSKYLNTRASPRAGGTTSGAAKPHGRKTSFGVP